MDRLARVGRASAETWSVRGGRSSPAGRFASAFASWAVTVTETVCVPLVRAVGVPQTSFGFVPEQLPVPSASNAGPADRPAAAQVTAPLPPVAAGAWNPATGRLRQKRLAGTEAPAVCWRPAPSLSLSRGGRGHGVASLRAPCGPSSPSCAPAARWRPWSRHLCPGAGPRPRPRPRLRQGCGTAPTRPAPSAGGRRHHGRRWPRRGPAGSRGRRPDGLPPAVSGRSAPRWPRGAGQPPDLWERFVVV